MSNGKEHGVSRTGDDSNFAREWRNAVLMQMESCHSGSGLTDQVPIFKKERDHVHADLS